MRNGYDVDWVQEWKKDPGDLEIIRIAYREKRTIITFDKDYAEIAIVKGEPHCGIIRLVKVHPDQQASVCLRVLNQHGENLVNGAIIKASLAPDKIYSGNKNK